MRMRAMVWMGMCVGLMACAGADGGAGDGEEEGTALATASGEPTPFDDLFVSWCKTFNDCLGEDAAVGGCVGEFRDGYWIHVDAYECGDEYVEYTDCIMGTLSEDCLAVPACEGATGVYLECIAAASNP